MKIGPVGVSPVGIGPVKIGPARTRRKVGLVALATLAFCAARAQSQEYPSKPIRILVPLSAGASYDINARLFAAWLEKNWKQPVIVENRTGAGGNIATDAAIKAPPDGYLLLVHGNAVTYQHLLLKSTDFRATRDLAPIGIFGGSGSMLTVPSSVPAKTLAEFVAYVKANPGKVNYGNSGNIIPEIEDLYNRLGLSMTAINYPGTAGQMTALLAGDVQLVLTIPLQIIPLEKDGRARALAYTGERRHPAMPEVPTVTETGLANFYWEFWVGLFGPPGLPEPIVTKLHAAVLDSNNSPDAADKFKALGQQPSSLSTEAMRQRMLASEKTATEVTTRLGIQPK
jgi:tripartite-type tricarboxylate transporter receptor subunit TctC